MEARNAFAERLVQAQIEFVANKNEACLPAFSLEPLGAESLPLQDHILKTGAAFTFYPEEKIAERIKGHSTVSNNNLIEESETPDGRKRIAVWNEGTQSRDIHEEIYTEQAGKHRHAQFAAYYDTTNNRITINVDGTDFTNIDDLKSAVQTVVGVTDMRMTRVKACINRAMAAFERHYPGRLADTPVDIYAHSTGANAVPLANYFLQREYGVTPRAQVMFDPLGAKNSFETVAGMIAQAEGRDGNAVFGELTRNTMSFKVKGGTFIDGLDRFDAFIHTGPGNAPATVGRVQTADVEGNRVTAHMGKAWVTHFNRAEI